MSKVYSSKVNVKTIDPVRFKDLTKQFYESGLFDYLIDKCSEDLFEEWKSCTNVDEREILHCKYEALEDIAFLFGNILSKD